MKIQVQSGCRHLFAQYILRERFTRSSFLLQKIVEVFSCDILYIFLSVTPIYFILLLVSLHGLHSPPFSKFLLRVKLSSLSLWALTPRHVMCPWKLLMEKGAGTRWMVGVLRQKWGKETEVWYKQTLQLWNSKLPDWVMYLINCAVRLLYVFLEITPLTMHSHANYSR